MAKASKRGYDALEGKFKQEDETAPITKLRGDDNYTSKLRERYGRAWRDRAR